MVRAIGRDRIAVRGQTYWSWRELVRGLQNLYAPVRLRSAPPDFLAVNPIKSGLPVVVRSLSAERPLRLKAAKKGEARANPDGKSDQVSDRGSDQTGFGPCLAARRRFVASAVSGVVARFCRV